MFEGQEWLKHPSEMCGYAVAVIRQWSLLQSARRMQQGHSCKVQVNASEQLSSVNNSQSYFMIFLFKIFFEKLF